MSNASKEPPPSPAFNAKWRFWLRIGIAGLGIVLLLVVGLVFIIPSKNDEQTQSDQTQDIKSPDSTKNQSGPLRISGLDNSLRFSVSEKGVLQLWREYDHVCKVDGFTFDITDFNTVGKIHTKVCQRGNGKKFYMSSEFKDQEGNKRIFWIQYLMRDVNNYGFSTFVQEDGGWGLLTSAWGNSCFDKIMCIYFTQHENKSNPHIPPTGAVWRKRKPEDSKSYIRLGVRFTGNVKWFLWNNGVDATFSLEVVEQKR